MKKVFIAQPEDKIYVKYVLLQLAKETGESIECIDTGDYGTLHDTVADADAVVLADGWKNNEMCQLAYMYAQELGKTIKEVGLWRQ